MVGESKVKSPESMLRIGVGEHLQGSFIFDRRKHGFLQTFIPAGGWNSKHSGEATFLQSVQSLIPHVNGWWKQDKMNSQSQKFYAN